ncbi:MAG: hypothetical protein Fur0016_20070 [Anaerolineales bacterium]
MTTQSQSKFTLGLLLFLTGIVLGVLLAGGVVWSDIEAVFYGLPHLTNETFGGLSCPPVMTRSETAHLRVLVRNDTDQSIAPLIRVEVSAPGLLSSSREKAPILLPGESTTLEFPVSQENIDLNFFIFAKAFRYPEYQTRLAEDTCGILVLNVPLVSGGVLLWFWLGLSALSILAGLWVLEKQNGVSAQRTNMLTGFRAMAIVLLVGMMFALQGAWFPGLAVLVVVTLFMLVFLYFALAQ